MSGLTKSQANELYRLYHYTTVPLATTARKWGLSLTLIRNHIREQGWPSRRSVTKVDSKNVAVRRKNATCRGLAECTERPAMIGRVWAAALAQINDLERRTKSFRTKRGSAQTRTSDDARAIAILVRTLKDLMTLDAKIEKGEGEKISREKHNTTDVNNTHDKSGWSALAEDLARRLDGLRKRGVTAGAAGGAERSND